MKRKNGKKVRKIVLLVILAVVFVIDGHSYTYSMGMMAPPEETIPQDAVDYFDGLLLAACREIIDLYS